MFNGFASQHVQQDLLAYLNFQCIGHVAKCGEREDIGGVRADSHGRALASNPARCDAQAIGWMMIVEKALGRDQDLDS